MRSAPLPAVLLAVSLTWLSGCESRSTPTSSPATSTTASAPAPQAALPSATASAAPVPTAAPATGPQGKILCFGDSITQADWPGKIAPEEKWVTVLQKKSDRINAVNAGRNGRTTGEGLAELGKALDENPDSAVVLFFLGVNDMKHGRPGVVEKATTNMSKMVDMTRQKLPKAEVVIAAPITINVDKLTPYFKGVELGPDTVHYMKALAVAYEGLAKKKGARFINLLDVVAPADLEDGVHANGRGQAKIAEAVWQGLSR
ncbi:Acyl-CoA thioesterase [Minicystis rosea]|nr:Acyl-CoA thioesterase [Minicystis rosea]